MKTYIFPRKIKYIATYNVSSVPCPFGGAITGKYSGVFAEGTTWPNAKVGSCACSTCKFCKKLTTEYVMCRRKE